MEIIIQRGVRWDFPTWTLSSIIATLYIPDLSLLSTIAWNVTDMDFIMKIILKVGSPHIIQVIWGLTALFLTNLSDIILKSEKVVVKYYVKSSGNIKIWNLRTNRLSKTFNVPRKIVVCASPLGLLIMTWFRIIA